MLRFLILALSFPALARAESPGFAVIAGDPATARLIAIVARDAAGPAVSAAPSPYDATLEFACDLRADDPGAAAKRLAGALRALPHGAKRHLWTEGIAGLLARRAVDELAGPDVVDALILVDVPNRGLSPSGWPEWDAALAGTPNWTISGSAFLRELNAKRQRELDVLTFNFWRRGGRTAPRASVLQLPRASLSAVVDAAAGSIPLGRLTARTPRRPCSPPGRSSYIRPNLSGDCSFRPMNLLRRTAGANPSRGGGAKPGVSQGCEIAQPPVESLVNGFATRRLL